MIEDNRAEWEPHAKAEYTSAAPAEVSVHDAGHADGRHLVDIAWDVAGAVFSYGEPQRVSGTDEYGHAIWIIGHICPRITLHAYTDLNDDAFLARWRADTGFGHDLSDTEANADAEARTHAGCADPLSGAGNANITPGGNGLHMGYIHANANAHPNIAARMRVSQARREVRGQRKHEQWLVEQAAKCVNDIQAASIDCEAVFNDMQRRGMNMSVWK